MQNNFKFGENLKHFGELGFANRITVELMTKYRHVGIRAKTHAEVLTEMDQLWKLYYNYRVTMVVAYPGWVDKDFDVPPSAQFCLVQ